MSADTPYADTLEDAATGDTLRKNGPLGRLSEAHLVSLQLQPVDLAPNRRLIRSGAVIENIYFLDSGVASILASPYRDHAAEVAMVGREGVVGVAAVTGQATAQNDAVMLLAGKGWRAPVEAVATAFHTSPAVRFSLLQVIAAMLSQLSANAAVNAVNKFDERLARWLLMAHDRASTDGLPVTHDVVARLLNVRRAGVSAALKQFEREGLTVGRRGAIYIANRAGLITKSNGAYTPV
jgi:CRP-like cAMP-binding protein